MKKEVKNSVSKVGHTEKDKRIVQVPFPKDAYNLVKEHARRKGLPAATFIRMMALEATEK